MGGGGLEKPLNIFPLNQLLLIRTLVALQCTTTNKIMDGNDLAVQCETISSSTDTIQLEQEITYLADRPIQVNKISSTVDSDLTAILESLVGFE